MTTLGTMNSLLASLRDKIQDAETAANTFPFSSYSRRNRRASWQIDSQVIPLEVIYGYGMGSEWC